ncbi:MAG: radical SAM protein [Nitrospirae bacterium]|nr:radical SAM protein [Nitrospirota bacterium]
MNKDICQQVFKGKRKPFSAWQIELTTRCPLKCRMCIRTGLGDWHGADMGIDDFKRLGLYFKDVEFVVLSGWGEPLLYKNLLDSIRLVKEGGAQAGFVTSGKGLNREYISEIINAGADFIGFSLAGATPDTHNYIRVNSDFKDLLNNIQAFNGIKKDRKLKSPNLHIVYLMLKDNISEVPLLIKLAKEIGINTVILTNIIHVTNEWQENQRVFICNENKSQGLKFLKEVEKKAKELKINLRMPSLSPVQVSVCSENPLSNLYISVDGNVSPCVYLYPPVSAPFKRIYCGFEHHLETLSFGNIFKESFHAVWETRKYSEFRDCFTERKRNFEKIFFYFKDGENIKRQTAELLSDAPEQCRICHKMLGV